MGIEKANILSGTITDNHDFFGIHLESKIDFDTEIGEQPIAIQCGWYTQGGESRKICFGSYGDFSCIVGASKSMKTVLKNAIVASYIGGRSNNYFDNFQGVDNIGKWVIDIDTEQSPWHVKRNVDTIRKLVGSKYPKYASFALRKYSVDERVGFLKWVVSESEYAGKIGLVCVDGAADLVKSVNDEEASYALAQLFMELTAEHNIHLITVLHKNSTGGKPTGHLGSAILKKAESVAFLKNNDDLIQATAEYTRNYPFRKFEFRLNEEALPILESLYDNPFTDHK